MRPDTLDLLVGHPFPGNVRELQNVVERSFILADGKWIVPEHLPTGIRKSSTPPESGTVAHISRGKEGLEQILAGVEREILERLLLECGTTYAMAERLKVNQSTVVRKLRKLGIRAHPAD